MYEYGQYCPVATLRFTPDLPTMKRSAGNNETGAPLRISVAPDMRD